MAHKPQTKDKIDPAKKGNPKKDNANLEQAVSAAADEIEEGLTGGFSGATTRVLDQDGPEVVMTEHEEAEESVVVIEEKRIELSKLPDLVTNQAGQVLIYGPFDEYRIVNADFGDYGVSMGMVLGFQIRDFFNKKESRMEKQPFPVYWNAETGKQVYGSGVAPEDYRKPKARA